MLSEVQWKKTHTHTDRFSSNLRNLFLVRASHSSVKLRKKKLRNFLGTSEDLEIENRQCVCRACEMSAKDCMKKNHNGESYRLRWSWVHQAKILLYLSFILFVETQLGSFSSQFDDA